MPLTQASGLVYNLKVIGSFIAYCRKHQIDFVYSHLQMPNFISSVSRFFIKAKVFTVRHNSDVTALSGTKKEQLIEKLINKLSNHIIAISDKVKQELVEKEGVNPAKIHRINNGYNFSAYDALSIGADEYRLIREKYRCHLLIVSPGRLIPTKRHQLTIQGIRELKQKGYDVRLLILGDGPEAGSVLKCIKDNGVEDRVHLPGYRENIADYLKAADVVALLSESEASSNIIKEAGYFEKPVIACEQVGDFSDYIVNGDNGFLISKNDPLPGFTSAIEYLITHKDAVSGIGSNLRQAIVKEFDMEAVGKQYEELQSKA
jgi:glycosyltransferase involved in cell wall biosynthesis